MSSVTPAIPFSANNPGSAANMHGRVGVRYPSPYFDLAQAYFPKNIRSLFRWCRYYALTYGPIYTFVQKMSAYSLTRLTWGDAKRPHTKEVLRAHQDRWKEFLEQKLLIYESTRRLGMHYWAFGNGYSSLHYPFRRLLVCPQCKHHKAAKDFGKREYRWLNFRFHGDCPKCKTSVQFKVFDLLVRTPNGMRIKVWNPEQVVVINNETTDDADYYYLPSDQFATRVRRGERRIIERTPWAFIQAIKKNTYVKFDPTNFFHIKAPSPDSHDMGLGFPPILAAIKDVFHLQLLKRAQEASAIERAIPFPIVHPMQFRSEAPTDPIGMVSLQKLMTHVRRQIDEARQDVNYIATSPVPIGVTHLWGEGKNLLMVDEVRAWTELIIADLGVPAEFIFGGLQWSGSNVSLRMLENQILSFREGYRRFTDFVVDAASRYLGWETVPYSWKPFKMADDIQQKQLLMTMAQMRKVGDRTLLSNFDLDPDDEFEGLQETVRREGELQKMQAGAQAEVEHEMQETQQRYLQAQSSQPFSAASGGAIGQDQNVVSYAAAVADRLMGQPPEVIEEVLMQLQQQQPALAQAVFDILQNQMGGGQASAAGQGGGGGQMAQMGQMSPMGQPIPPPGAGGPMSAQGMNQGGVMRPQPEQRAPRREAGSAAI